MPQAKSHWKKYLLIAVKLCLSVLIIGWLVRKETGEKGFESFLHSDRQWTWLFTAFLVCVFAHIISFIRWHRYVTVLGIPFTLWDAIRIGFMGMFFGLFLFGIVGGDSLKVYYTTRQSSNQLAEAVCSVLADRITGMLTMFTFATIGFLVIGIDVEDASNPKTLEVVRYLFVAVTAGTVVGWLSIGGFLLFGNPESLPLVQRLGQVPWVGHVIARLASVAYLYRRRLSTLVYGFGLSVLANVCYVITIYLIAVGMNVQHPNLLQHCLIAPVSMAANAVPLFLQIGGMEFVLTWCYESMSSDAIRTDGGVVVAITFRLVLFLVSGLGAIAWLANRRRIAEIISEHESDETLTIV